MSDERVPLELDQASDSSGTSRREGVWASPVSRLKVGEIQAGAVNINVDGRQVLSPLKGFGQLWQKTYRIRLGDAQVSPQEVIRIWKQNFSSFWPKGNDFYGPLTGISPGDVAVLNLAGPGGIRGPGGMPLISTGVLVIYADDESFSFLTPEGHMFAAMITFSAYEEEGTVVQIQALIRANDPIYELGLRMGVIHKTEDQFWQATLKNLAAHVGVQDVYVTQIVTCIDPRLQWSEAKNIWQNAAMRTGFYIAATPIRWVRNRIRR